MPAERYDDFDRLMLRHGKFVRWLCWIYSGGDETRMADLVQEVLLGLWQCRATLRPGANEMQERAWIRWHCRSVLQHLRRRKQVDILTIEQSELEAMDVPEDVSETEKQRELLYSLAEGLTEHERTVLEMLMDNYSIEEIAKQLKIKAHSVSQLKLRILEKMREKAERKSEL